MAHHLQFGDLGQPDRRRAQQLRRDVGRHVGGGWMLGDRASAGLGLLEDQHGGERGPLGPSGRDKSSILPQGRYRPPAPAWAG